LKAIIYTDGGARPTNPGHAGFAVAIDVEGEITEISRYIGWKTNNEAEYAALIVGLKFAYASNVNEVHVVTDSKLVKHQVEGDWTVNKPHLKMLRNEAQDYLNKFEKWTIEHVKGHSGHPENERVDVLCTDAILAGMRKNKNPFRKIAGLPRAETGALVEPFQ